MANTETSVERDYGTSGLQERIRAALDEAGVDLDHLTPEILAPIDQIHGGGLPATVAHAALVDIAPDMRMLDIGCGIGGPARYFAGEFGCRVTGIDLAEEFVDAAAMLTGMSGLNHLVDFQCANALHLPFDDAGFDVVWCLNVTMNIEDRSGFYAEVRRVLKPGGRFALSESGQGPAGDPYFPLPWAREPSYNFLVPPGEMRAALEAAGFRITAWLDETRKRQNAGGAASGAGAPPSGPLSITVVRGDDYPARRANAARSVAEDRLTNVTLVAERTD